MTEIDAEAALNACEYFYLDHYCEHEDGVFVVVIDETRFVPAQPANMGETNLDDAPDRTPSIEAGPAWARFTLTFRKYLAISVVDESYDFPEDKDGKGWHLRTYEKSKFRDYVRATTWGDDDFPGPFTHYALFCLNHTINVAAFEPPEIVASIQE